MEYLYFTKNEASARNKPNLRMSKFKMLFPFLGILLGSELKSQVNIPDGLQRIDKSSDTTTLTFYKSIKHLENEGVQLLTPLIKLSYNSAYPRSYNDGPVWKGKGFTFEAHGGISGRKGKFSYTLHPTLYFSQNADFNGQPSLRPDISSHGYQFILESRSIDWAQRYGSSSFVSLHPGQSELQFQTGKFYTALSTQNYSVGPAILNPIILGRQAGGFPHLRIGAEPFDINIKGIETGKWELNFLIGFLSESDYFDEVSNNNTRYLNGLFLAYQPKFLPELTVGFNRTLYKDTRYFEGKDLFSTVVKRDDGIIGDDTLSINDTFDQVAAAFIDWNFQEAGFRAYLEFARNDFSGKFIRFLREPEHSRGYTIGFEKTLVTAKDKTVSINYEHSNLSRNQSFLYQPGPIFYAHEINRQGYTHDGQILGAGIGPGGNSDYLEVQIKNAEKIMGIFLQRIESNRDYFVVNIQDRLRHDQEYSVGFNLQKELPSMFIGFESIISYNLGRYYEDDIVNLYLAFGTKIRVGE